MTERLAIVMPVYNEQDSLPYVLDEWLKELDHLNLDYCILAIDDGSHDNCLSILKGYEENNPGKLQILHHENKGHGQSCIAGYQLALTNGFDYILQIDSDGQCDPKFLKQFWQCRNQSPVFGYRATRDDGKSRWWISRIVSLVGFIGAGVWVKDANVPYRLVHRDQLSEVVQNIPKDFHLANVLVSLRLRQKFGIKWIHIHFRDRFAGSASVKTFNFAQQGLRLLQQLWMSQTRNKS